MQVLLEIPNREEAANIGDTTVGRLPIVNNDLESSVLWHNNQSAA